MKLNPSPLLIDFLRHIQQEMLFVTEQTAGITRENVLDEPTLRRALTQSLVVIGDTCKKVPDSFRQETTEFDWSKFVGFSDYLVHRYWGIDQDLFWEAISVEVPINKEWIDVIIEQEASKL